MRIIQLRKILTSAVLMNLLFLGICPVPVLAQSTLEYMGLQSQVQGASQQALEPAIADNQGPQTQQTNQPTDWLKMLKDLWTSITSKIPPVQLGIIFVLLVVACFYLRS